MTWLNFPAIAIGTIVLWAIAILFYYLPPVNKTKQMIANACVILGLLAVSYFILTLWIHLERPPLRTLGETRLWYAFFLPLIGIITVWRWKYKWFMAYSLSLAILFLVINYLNPETYDQALMPALQSPWFVPHVIVYIFSYAMLAASSMFAIKELYLLYFQPSKFEIKTLYLGDNLVYIGFSFLTLGLLFGALWAKEAWGHYWTWDPKETWALLTWIGYLIYVHFRYFQPKKVKSPLWTLSLAFVVLLICWFGLNYLPSAQNSVHVYSK